MPASSFPSPSPRLWFRPLPRGMVAPEPQLQLLQQPNFHPQALASHFSEQRQLSFFPSCFVQKQLQLIRRMASSSTNVREITRCIAFLSLFSLFAMNPWVLRGCSGLPRFLPWPCLCFRPESYPFAGNHCFDSSFFSPASSLSPLLCATQSLRRL